VFRDETNERQQPKCASSTNSVRTDVLRHGSEDECSAVTQVRDGLRNRLIVRPASPALREQNAYYCGDNVVVTMFVMSRHSVLCTVARCLFSCVFGLIFRHHSILPLTGN
jgi:hypothetical protein